MSLLSFFGGKSAKPFMELINSNIPKTGIKTYIETFSGSYATYMDDKSLKFDTVIYNDKNRHLVNLYYCAREPEKLLAMIEKLKETILRTDATDKIEKWNFYKGVYNKFSKNDFLDKTDFELGDFKKAAMYAFLATSSFSSVYPRGGGFAGYKKPQDKLKLEAFIKKLKTNKYTDKLNSITEFYNTDFEELIHKYDSEETFFYLDPPYYRLDSSTGEDDTRRLFWYGADSSDVFGPASHRRLLNLIKETKGRWSLSYYYFPLLEELLPKDKYIWLEKQVDRPSSRGGNNCEVKTESSKGTELLILNYDPKTGIKL